MKTRPSLAIETDALMLLLPMLQVEPRRGTAEECAAAAAAQGAYSSAAVTRLAITRNKCIMMSIDAETAMVF